ncbi:uncharacterized protein LOC141969729 [Athene noctua]|uniref:uncharacterized protein LOC141969729 n=1 Tax=Athene noctua TaxID=126797 RepID=UPI003EB712E6
MTSLSPVVNTGLIPAPPPPQQKRGNTVRKYDDDIEAEERQIDDQMSGTSESPSGDEKPDLDTEKESETLSEKALEVSDSEKDEDDKYSDSDFWDNEQVLEDCSPVQVETATAPGCGRHVYSEPDDSCPDVEEEVLESGEYDASEAPDGTFVAEGRRTLDVQEASEKAGRERTMLGETKAIEEAHFVEEEEVFTKEAGEEVERLGDLLPEDEAVAVLQAEGQPVVEESAPEESAMAEGDPKGQGIGKGRAFGIEMTPGEQGVLVEGMESEAELEERGTGEEELPGAGELLDEEESRMQPEGRGGAEESSESDEEESEEEESDGEEDMEEGDTSGEDDMASDMSEGEEDGDAGEFEGTDVRSPFSEEEEEMDEVGFEGEDVLGALFGGEEDGDEGEFEGMDVASPF